VEDRVETSPQYEFDAHQNEVIRQLSRSMRWVAIPFLFLGIMYGIVFALSIVRVFADPRGILAVLFIGLAMLFFLALGRWTRKAAASFERVTETAGQDVSHLMEALDNLRKTYSLLILIVKIYVGLLLLMLIFAAIAMLLPALKA